MFAMCLGPVQIPLSAQEILRDCMAAISLAFPAMRVVREGRWLLFGRLRAGRHTAVAGQGTVRRQEATRSGCRWPQPALATDRHRPGLCRLSLIHISEPTRP